MLPDIDQLILAYCCIGRRSKLAAEILVKLGYTNINQFGVIIDWPYEVESWKFGWQTVKINKKS